MIGWLPTLDFKRKARKVKNGGSVLEIIAHGAWNGGTLQDNSIFENKGMFFKGDRPVNDQAIQERIGVRTRMAASPLLGSRWS